jgi:hypothetical protein
VTPAGHTEPIVEQLDGGAILAPRSRRALSRRRIPLPIFAPIFAMISSLFGQIAAAGRWLAAY